MEWYLFGIALKCYDRIDYRMLKETELFEDAVLGSVQELKGTRYKVRLIEGDRLGSSGYYPSEVLRNDGPKVFKKGTPMFLDHQLPTEKNLRPFGTIDTYAGELAEDAYYEDDGLYAEVEVFEHQAPKIKALKDRIGVSIRATATYEEGEINGQSTRIVKGLLKARSADFVMRAGAGGQIMSVLESAIEDSEATSEAEEGRENMDEVLEAIKGLKSDYDARFTALEESLKAAKRDEVEVEAEESEVNEDKVLELAEAFVSSNLDAEGRKRVLELHKATKKPVKELIEAEEAYVKSHTKATTEVEGVEESAEVEESAKEIALPSAWKKKDK